MHGNRSVMLLIATGVLLGIQAGSAQAAAAPQTSVVQSRISDVEQSLTLVTATGPAIDPNSAPGADTRVSVRVLAVPSTAPTTTSTPAPTATPGQPATPPPAPGGGGGIRGLPRTGMTGQTLAPVVALGLGALTTGVLLIWMATLRRRQESMV